MLEITDLTHINAALNTLTMVFLGAGFVFIRRGERTRHRACMLIAIAITLLFFVSYGYYKMNSGFAKFGGEGLIRPIYFSVLVCHVLGAASLLILVPITVTRALLGRIDKHRRIAKFAWRLWVAVGLSGLFVYALAVHVFPVAPPA